jgi:adenylyltransferase/sulfurtransferase
MVALDNSRGSLDRALCKMGTRSAKAVQLLSEVGVTQVRSLTGGIHAWSDRVDPSIRKY